MKKNFDELRSQMSEDHIARSSERAQKMLDELLVEEAGGKLTEDQENDIEQQERKACAELRAGVLEGYQDILVGRAYKFEGNLQAMLDDARNRGDLKKSTARDPIDGQVGDGIKDAVLEGPSFDGVDLDRDQSPMRDADL